MQSQKEFLAFLDDLALPHRASLRDIRARYGVRPSRYYDWDIIEIADARPIVLGQRGRFNFNANLEPDLLPPISFSAFIAGDADVTVNHEETLAALSAILGDAPQDKSASNTISHIWRFESAALEIISWPAALNRRFTNPAIARHPELADFCLLRLTNGYRPPLTPEEAGWLRDPAPFANQGQRVRPAIEQFDPLWAGPTRALYRWLPAEFRRRPGALGRSRDDAGLVGIGEGEAFMLRRADIRALRLSHVLPARSAGGSGLVVEYADRFSSDRKIRPLQIASGSEIHDLDALAAEIAGWAGVAVTIAEYQAD